MRPGDGTGWFRRMTHGTGQVDSGASLNEQLWSTGYNRFRFQEKKKIVLKNNFDSTLGVMAKQMALCTTVIDLVPKRNKYMYDLENYMCEMYLC